MDVLDRLQSGLFFHPSVPSVLDSTPTISQPHIVSHRALPTINYRHNASSSIPTTASFSINHPPTPEVPLPLLSVSADVDIHGRLCTTKVTQQFSNASSSISQNAKYVFPIYDGSVVTSFRCWIGNDKLLEGAVKAKEAARADFKHAVSQRKVAVLVEELAPEVFETSVGNIPAQTTVKIEITYANLLKVDNTTGGLVLTIPTSIAPRYGNVPVGYNGNQSLLTEGLRINVQASMPAAIRKMESRSHPISVEMGAVAHKSFKNFAAGASSDMVDYSKGRATLSDRQAILHQDFVLHILCSSREPSQSRAIAATQPGQPGISTIAVTIHPGDLFRENVNVKDFAGEIIFMVDRSGSMRSKIPSLINVMNIFLRSLPEASSFNISSFGTNVTWLWPCSKGYSQENLDVASKHVDLFLADYGGTNIYRALQSVLDHYNRQNDVPTSVILLTDGEVWDVDNVIQLVRRTVSIPDSNIRFFSLGIGDRVSHRLVEGIGQQGGGYAEVVPESSMGSWQERVIQMVKAALTPSRLQCSVDFGQDFARKTSERQIAGYSVQSPEWVQAPHHIPVLNTFSHFSLYYTREGELDSLPKAINITATTDQGEKLTAQLPIQTVAEQPAIHHLAAKALINDFETGQSWLHSLNPTLKSFNPTGFEKILEQEAVDLGQRWSIPSRWTSYVAIDRTTAQQHAISIHKADAIQVSELTRPRHTSPYAPIEVFGLGQPPPTPPWYTRSGRDSQRGYSGSGEPMTVPMTVPPSPPRPHLHLCAPMEAKLPRIRNQRHPEPQANPPPQQLPQNKEKRPFDATKSLRDTGRALEQWAKIRNQAMNTAESGRDSSRATPHVACRTPDEDGQLASGDQFGEEDVFVQEFIPPPDEGFLPPPGTSDEEGLFHTRRRTYLDESRSNSPDSPDDEAELTTATSLNDREDRVPKYRRLPGLGTILREQQADGKFLFLSHSFRSALRKKYDTNALEGFLYSRFNPKSQTTRARLTELCYNILMIVHITHEHDDSEALWELQVAKAQQWIKRTIKELLQERGDAEETPEASLEELVESILGEIEKRVLQQI